MGLFKKRGKRRNDYTIKYYGQHSRLRQFFHELSVLLAGGGIFFLILFGAMELHNPLSGINFLGDAFGTTYAIDDKENITQSILKVCSLEEHELHKIECVHDIYSQNYHYTENLTGFKIENGTFYGDCDSSVNFFCSIYQEMGFNCYQISAFGLGHAYGRVEWSGGYCNVEQQHMECIGIGGDDEEEMEINGTDLS